MELQSFIQSGLLEFYALGQVTAEERSLVERMLVQHTEARTELAAIEQAVESYAQAFGTPPPAWMKGRILDQIEQSPLPKASVAMPVPPNGVPVLRRALQLLSLLLLLASAFLWTRNNQLRDENATQQAQIVECDQLSEIMAQIDTLLSHNATKLIPLENDGKNASALVYANPGLKHTFLNTASVKAAHPQNTYLQVWAIVGGKPVSMGMVNVDAPGGWQEIPYMENVEAFAISLENKRDGNLTPTTVVMSGKLNG